MLQLECMNKERQILFLHALQNATYLSWKVQNEIILIKGSQIQEKTFLINAENKDFFSFDKPLM